MLHTAGHDIGYLLLHSQRKRMTAIVIIYIIFIIFSAKIDAEHINRQQYFSDHFSRFILRLVVSLGMSSGGIGVLSPIVIILGIIRFCPKLLHR